jgi:hypothetical protein
VRKRITRISPWQTAKTCALVYYAAGVLVIIPMGLLASFVPSAPGQNRPSLAVILLMPVLYGALALVFVPLACWIYNMAAKFTGGIEFQVETSGEDA